MTKPRDPDFEAKVRRSFSLQGMMETLGARLERVEPGAVDISLRPAAAIAQQHGFVHAGAVAAILDSACGYAALSTFPAGVGVLTSEFKINLLAPSTGDRIVAEGRVVRAGRKLAVCLGEAYAEQAGARKLVAMMTASMMVIEDMGISD